MTTQANQTLNQENVDGINAVRGGEASSASQLDQEHFNPDSENIIETVSDEIGGVDVSSGGKHQEPASSKADEEGGKEKPAEPAQGEDKTEKGKETPAETKDFHEHPDWKRMITERNDARSELKQANDKIQTLEGRLEAIEKGAGPDVQGILELGDEELTELFNDNPRNFVAGLLQAAENASVERFKAAQTEQNNQRQSQAVEKLYEQFEKDNPDFRTQWDEGELAKFVMSNPGHTPISAYLLKSRENFEKTTTERLEKEIETRIREEYRNKTHADVLGAGPSAAPTSTNDAELKDTSKTGGVVATIARRVMRGRQNVA